VQLTQACQLAMIVANARLRMRRTAATEEVACRLFRQRTDQPLVNLALMDRHERSYFARVREMADQRSYRRYFRGRSSRFFASASAQIDENPRASGGFRGGRYWARTSDPQLVELVLSQLS
jgi:hypothetical protein